MSKLNYSIDGGPNGVTVLKQGFNVDPLLQKQAACISTMTYNEYWQLIEAGMKPDDLTVFKYENEGVSTLEDGLYTTDAELKDPASVERLAKFVKASMQGWQYALAHQDEAVKIVLAADTAGAQTAAHQKRMMSEIAKLVAGGSKGLGYLDESSANRTVQVLMTGKSDPVITKKPVGAWTHVVWDKAGVQAASSGQ
jgi:NitT/TauT family transport system substrate-binding protein